MQSGVLYVYMLHSRGQIITRTGSVKFQDIKPTNGQIILQQLVNAKKYKKCPEELKSFILTINFYSPKAYTFVRDSFDNVLPSPRTMRNWYSEIELNEGVQNEAVRIQQMRQDGKTCLLSVSMDEMTIRKRIESAKDHFIG